MVDKISTMEVRQRIGDMLNRVALRHDEFIIDDKYIAAAIEGRAAFLVSGDPDLLAIGEHQGVRFVTPRAFLANIRSAGPLKA